VSGFSTILPRDSPADSKCTALMRQELLRPTSPGVRRAAVQSTLTASGGRVPPPAAPATLMAPALASSTAPSSVAGTGMPSLAAWVAGPTSASNALSHTLTTGSAVSALLESVDHPSTTASAGKRAPGTAPSSAGGVTLTARTQPNATPNQSPARTSMSAGSLQQINEEIPEAAPATRKVPEAPAPVDAVAVCTALKAEAQKGDTQKLSKVSRRPGPHDSTTHFASAVLAAMEDSEDESEEVRVPPSSCCFLLRCEAAPVPGCFRGFGSHEPKRKPL
jgi:hypothetical protein